MSHLAVIPARSGSKGLKDKNIKMLAGKPMLAYTIQAAETAGVFDEIHVSTDSEVYGGIAKKYGAQVPFLRSEKTSSDQAGSWEVVKEVLERYDELGMHFDTVTLLQPTSPLRTAENIREAYDLFQGKRAEAVVSVCAMEHSPLWSNTLSEDLSMDSFIDVDHAKQRQGLKTYYRINGALYMIRRSFLYEDTNIYRKGCYAYVMDGRRSVDIDGQLDFDIAEYFLVNSGEHVSGLSDYNRPE